MANVSEKFRSLLVRYRLLQRGESIVMLTGIATCAVLLLTVAITAAWVGHAQRDSDALARDVAIKSLSNVLSSSAETLLSGGDLSALRRIVIESARTYQLSECRVVLPDGKVIADAEPTKITLAQMPAEWPRGPIDEAQVESTAEIIRLAQPLKVPGRGAAVLHVTATRAAHRYELTDVQKGVAVIGAIALGAMLLVYRRVRQRMLTLGLIRDSLLAKAAGCATTDALRLAEQHGPEAAAWNSVLAESENLRKATIAENATNQLRARSAKRSDLEYACDALSVGVIVVDDNAKVKSANGAAAGLLMAKKEELIGAHLCTLLPNDELKEALTAIVSGTGQRKQFIIERKDVEGGGVLRVYARPLRREDCGGALVTVEDITQQRVADASRNSFIAQATHELRTPLTNMRLCLETILDAQHPADQQTVSYNMNVLNQETRRLERMVTEMLSVSEIEAGSMRLRSDDVRLDKLLEEIHRDFEPQAKEKQIALSLDLPPKMPTFQGDRDKLMLTLQNLVGNAIKYTPAGGKCMVSAKADGDRALVEVTDTGFGIDPKEHELIFERFYRAKDPRVSKVTGTGLGLSLAREVIRLHGGEISLRSELNKGSTFTVTLPQAKAA